MRTLILLLFGTVALRASSPDIALTLPLSKDSKLCFPQEGSPVKITGERVTFIPPLKNRRIAFTGGLVPIRVNNRWGYMDSSYRVAIAPQFEKVGPFVQDRAVVVVGQRYGYIDRAGLYIAEPQFSSGFDFDHGVASVRSGDRWGLIGLDGQWVVSPRFSRLDLLVGGLFAETFTGEQGFIDTRGAFIRSGRLGDSYRAAK